jgi:outer membrane protein assembly factor BamB
MYTNGKAVLVSIVLMNLMSNQSLSADSGKELIEMSGVQGGLVVVLNSEQITSEIRVNDKYLVQGLFEDEKSRKSARAKIQSRGIYGPVTVRTWGGRQLPYIDNMVNVIVVLGARCRVSGKEIQRVLAPRGVAVIRKEGNEKLLSSFQHPVSSIGQVFAKFTKPWPGSIDEWTHWLHAPDNNAVSGDAYDEVPRGLQWAQSPLWVKSHQLAPPFSSMVTARGRLFYIIDETNPGFDDMPDRWRLIARDAFNGTLLWKKPIKEWGEKYYMPGGKAGDGTNKGHPRTKSPQQVLRRLVAVGDKVFVTIGFYAPVSMLDAASGEVIKTFKGTEGAFEILCKDDRLYLAINTELKVNEPDPDITIMAVDINSGKAIWKTDAQRGIFQTSFTLPQYVDVYLTSGREGLFFLGKDEIIGLDHNTGKRKWSVSCEVQSGRNKTGLSQPFTVLAYYESVVLCGRSQKGSMSYKAIDADSGKLLWTKTASTMAYHSPPDLFVNQGLLWVLNSKEWTYEGLNPLTGKKKKSIDMSLIRKGTHHNCYRNKATQSFFLYGRNKGVEFFGINNKSKRINWAKGACRYGIMPANGMIYFPPHFCTCYATSKMNGIVAIGNTGITEAKPSTSDQVTKGSAYGKELSAVSGEDDWPTYRQNIARTGFQPAPLSDKLKVKWTSKIKGSLTPPVIADQKVFVASKDDHRVICLDAENGKTKWTFLPEGKVDSPPSYYKGRLVFGARDGFVYCLDAQSGELAWRFRAAPEDKQMGAFEQVESVWPLFGTLLVHDDKVYCTAGRHPNVNMGIYLYQLDINTGRPLTGVHHIADISEQGEVVTSVHADILVGDGNIMHLRGMVFEMKTLKMIDIGKRFIERAGASKGHNMEIGLIMALGGFLEDSFFNGSLWHYKNETANILSLDKENLYGVNIYSKNSFKSHMHTNFHPGKQRIKLFAAGLKTSAPKAESRKSKKGKGGGSSWNTTIPTKAKSLLVGPENIYLAGVRDIVDEKDPWAHFDGRMGGMITIHSKADGKLKRQIELKSPPVFDGLASAAGKLFVSCKDGSVLCFE